MQSIHCDSEAAVLHADRASIGKSIKVTPQGYVEFVAPIARVGWLQYKNLDGSERQEYVSAEVLKKSADSFKMKPITRGHPSVGLLNSTNVKEHQVGMTGHSVYFDGTFLWMTGTITDHEAGQDVLSGRAKQISSGYTAKVSLNPDGTFNQDERDGDHIAIVPYGRAGAEVGFRFDAIDDAWIGTTEINEEAKLIVKLDGKEFEIEDAELAVAIASQLSKYENLQNTNATLTTRIDALEGEKTGLSLRLDEAEKARLTDEDITKAAEERVKSWLEVAPLLRADGIEFTPDYKLSPAQVKKLYLEKKYSHLNLDGKSDDYLTALWDASLGQRKEESAKQRTDSIFDSLNFDARGKMSDEDEGYEEDAIAKARRKRAKTVEQNSKKGMM